MFGNDTSTLKNTDQMHYSVSQLAQLFHSRLTGIFQAFLPWKLSEEVFTAVQCVTDRTAQGNKAKKGLCLFPYYSPFDAYTSINDMHVTRLNATNCDSNINHLYTVTDNLLRQTSRASLAILGSTNS